jgi:hypothetical protein
LTTCDFKTSGKNCLWLDVENACTVGRAAKIPSLLGNIHRRFWQRMGIFHGYDASAQLLEQHAQVHRRRGRKTLIISLILQVSRNVDYGHENENLAA